ncbi:hypothetical protein CF253_17025 [Salmonella enterica]|nr:hypothetical protein [Salmonella enterica]EBS8342304.1 hypothetical protein [Salmonella enterica]EBS8685810.1 hypothetical protein [Salmonella enterica]EBT3584133.1 hypothetical protein [Salmonella enterica]EBT5381273.1 hypothetical protein [Salmonella enterica]
MNESCSISVRSANAMGNSSLSIDWLTIDSTPPVRSMKDNSDIGARGDNITNINTSIHQPLSAPQEAHATIKLTIDTQPPAEPTLGSTVSSLDNTVILKGVVEAHQDIQVNVTVNDTDYTASVDNDTGNWHVSVPQSAILSRANQYTITATDPAGNSTAASGTFTGTSPTENPVNKSSGVDEMISLSGVTWHSVSVDENIMPDN